MRRSLSSIKRYPVIKDYYQKMSLIAFLRHLEGGLGAPQSLGKMDCFKERNNAIFAKELVLWIFVCASHVL